MNISEYMRELFKKLVLKNASLYTVNLKLGVSVDNKRMKYIRESLCPFETRTNLISMPT